MSNPLRFSTGLPDLDRHLGGGLLPGTLTVVVGASGIGKTHLGVHFANAGLSAEKRPGLIFDMSARIDAQGHEGYLSRLAQREPREMNPEATPDLENFFAADQEPGDFLRIFSKIGRRVTRDDLDFDHWHDWQAHLAAKLATTIGFFYGNFARGSRRVVVDGIEPVDNPADSIQFELFEYIYHQILHKDSQWVARDLFRQKYRDNAAAAEAHAYDHRQLACLLLYTSRETMLHDLITRPLDEGDLLSGANTLIYMGKILEGSKLRRGMLIAKHRGSACTDEVLQYTIDDGGLKFEPI